MGMEQEPKTRSTNPNRIDMSLDSYISGLVAKGITLSLDQNQLKLEYPPGILTDQIRQYLKNNKQAIIDRLREKDNKPIPHISKKGDLIIPFDSDPKFHWWNGGLSTKETKKYLNENETKMKAD